MKLSFDTTIGDDVFVNVSGNYDKADKSVGYFGSFEVEQVMLQNDDTNIISLLSQMLIDRLEDEGMQAYHQQKDDAKLEAAEARYQANLEYQRFLKEGE